ncbi:MAG: SAP domain-containing protein [Candidatus Thalassarchaeaceae archaeon]|nr:SAP domain-containing protein [Candidatus Thalassarchaeaceae archaeon]
MDKDELSALTVAELKVRLKELNLTTSGKKADLITRLIESEDEGDVFILDEDDDGDPTSDHSEIDVEEVYDAEVFEAEIIVDDEIDSDIFETVSSTATIVSNPTFPRTVWYKDGTAIATILVVLLLAGAGGWWYLSNEASVYQSAPSRYGDDLQFTVSNGLLLADGDEMVALLRDALAPSALDDVCDELRIEFSGTGSSSITDGSISDLLDPSDTELEGAVMAQDAYGRTWNTVQSNLNYDLSADLSGYTWSAINQDSCSSLEWLRRNNQLDLDVNQWHEITERSLLRSQTALNFVDSEGQTFSSEATTFDGLIGSDTISELVGAAVLPMHPVNLYDIFGLTVLEEGLTGETDDGYWGWRVGSTSTIGGQDAIQIRMHHIKIGECLGKAEMILWAIPGQPLAAKQIVDVHIDKSKTESGCSFTESEAIDLTFPEGEIVVRYTLEQISFKRGTELLDWQTYYATRPDSSDGKPSASNRISWINHMPDNSTTRFNLEQAVSCVMTDAAAFPEANAALNGDGYVFAAKDDRTGSDPTWNLSWISSSDAGWVRVTWPGGENCYNSGDGFFTVDEKPEHSRDQIPQTHKLASLESRMVSSVYYPNLHSQITSNGNLRSDVHIGYALVVPEENAVSEWLDEFDLMGGKVTVYLERTWTSGDSEHNLRVGMDAETGRMAGWALASTPV